MTGSAQLALFKLKKGLIVGSMGAMTKGALAPLERHMRYLLLKEIALVGMAHQAKIRDFLR